MVAQGLGGKFTKEGGRIPGEAAEFPNAEPGGNLGDSCDCGICGFERSSNLVERSMPQISHRRFTEVLLKRSTKDSLRNTDRSTELFHRQVFALMLVDKNHRHANNLLSR